MQDPNRFRTSRNPSFDLRNLRRPRAPVAEPGPARGCEEADLEGDQARQNLHRFFEDLLRRSGH